MASGVALSTPSCQTLALPLHLAPLLLIVARLKIDLTAALAP